MTGTAEITGVPAPPYLSGEPDADARGSAYCTSSPYFTWRNSLSASAISRVTGVDDVRGVTIIVRWPDGRARTVRVQSSDGAAHDFEGHHFYSRASAVLGYKVVPSALFEISNRNDGSFELDGHGVGHGVGMCQWGANGRASAGQRASAILAAYFPGTVVASAP